MFSQSLWLWGTTESTCSFAAQGFLFLLSGREQFPSTANGRLFTGWQIEETKCVSGRHKVYFHGLVLSAAYGCGECDSALLCSNHTDKEPGQARQQLWDILSIWWQICRDAWPLYTGLTVCGSPGQIHAVFLLRLSAHLKNSSTVLSSLVKPACVLLRV